MQGLGAHAPTFFRFYDPLHLVAAGSGAAQPRRNEPEDRQAAVQVLDLESGESHAYVPVSSKANRIDFVGGGRQILYLAPDNIPAIAPVGIENKFRDLCAVVYEDFNRREVEQKDSAFAFCDATITNYAKPPGLPAVVPWILTAPPRNAGNASAAQ